MNKMSFEDSINRIEEIIKVLENNDIELEMSIKLYEEGITLTSQCYNQLNNIEKQSIRILNESEINKLRESNNE